MKRTHCSEGTAMRSIRVPSVSSSTASPAWHVVFTPKARMCPCCTSGAAAPAGEFAVNAVRSMLCSGRAGRRLAKVLDAARFAAQSGLPRRRQHAMGSVTLQQVHVQATSLVQERLWSQAILPYLLPRSTHLSPQQ